MNARATARLAYVDGPFGQVHLRIWGDTDAERTLLCLASAPSSGVAYATIAPYLARGWRVVAMDYPGYGMSQPAPQQPTIADFARTALAVIAGPETSGAVTLTGFHTGALVAVEAAVIDPAAATRLVLIDVPFFGAERQAELRKLPIGRIALTPDLSSLQPTWDTMVTKRMQHVALDRAFALFVDQLGSGARAHEAFQAAFRYDAADRFAKVEVPVTVIATQAGLHAETCAAAAAMAHAELIELDIAASVLDAAAERVAEVILAHAR